jgi:hypothetical protein
VFGLSVVATSPAPAAASSSPAARTAHTGTAAVLGWPDHVVVTTPAAAARRQSPRAGIVPPANPPRNIYPPDPDFESACSPDGSIDDSTTCLSATLQATDHARSTEPLEAMALNIGGLQSLTVAEQLFAITDLERVDRGLPPATAMTTQLDQIAATGADAGTDPNANGVSPAGGGYFEAWGSNWAGGTYNALATNYYWMYDDGYPSGNISCNSPSAQGCWGHRDNILGAYLGGGCNGPTALLMGAAATTSPSQQPSPSLADIIAGQCGTPAGVVFTWAQAEQALGTTAGGTQFVGMAPTPDGQGYWIADSAGRVWNYGDAPDVGDASARQLGSPVVAIAASPVTKGFWLVTAAGAVYAFGVTAHGDLAGHNLAAPIVGITATRDGEGYWLVASDGGIFSFGDARYHGSEGGHHLNAPIVAIAADPASSGYWMVASDGGVFSFDAPFYGSEGAHHLNGPIVGMSVARHGSGYRFVASDGGIFSFRAPFYGSEGAAHLHAPITAMTTDPVGGGYWMVATDGGLFAFHAVFRGTPA